MTKINWTRVRQENQVRKHGLDYADDIPSFGSWADQRRVANGAAGAEVPVELNRHLGTIPKVRYGNSPRRPKPRRELAKCPVCGQMVARMSRHLSKAHQAETRSITT